jgi:hypothetical protein
MAAVGNMVTGLCFWDPHSLDLACTLAGCAAVGYFWHTTAASSGGRPALILCRVVFAVVAGLAVYANLAWLLKAIGLPVGLLTTHQPSLKDTHELGPAVLLCAVGCYAVMRLLCHAPPKAAQENREECRLDSGMG